MALIFIQHLGNLEDSFSLRPCKGASSVLSEGRENDRRKQSCLKSSGAGTEDVAMPERVSPKLLKKKSQENYLQLYLVRCEKIKFRLRNIVGRFESVTLGKSVPPLGFHL